MADLRAGAEDPRALRSLAIALIALALVGLFYLTNWQRERGRKARERQQYQAVMQDIQRRTWEATRGGGARTPAPR
jgi:hypothetical protein